MHAVPDSFSFPIHNFRICVSIIQYYMTIILQIGLDVAIQNYPFSFDLSSQIGKLTFFKSGCFDAS